MSTDACPLWHSSNRCFHCSLWQKQARKKLSDTNKHRRCRTTAGPEVHSSQKPKLKVTAHTLQTNRPASKMVNWFQSEQGKKVLFFRWLALLFDNFVMQRWKSAVEIPEHSTRLQERGATDNLIYDLQTRTANTHGRVWGVIHKGMNNSNTQVKLRTHARTRAHTSMADCWCCLEGTLGS